MGLQGELAVDRSVGLDGNSGARPAPLHPAWQAFLRFCAELRHGEIERLSIQDGLPVLAEMTKKKIKFIRS
jgi:hypothetical protein